MQEGQWCSGFQLAVGHVCDGHVCGSAILTLFFRKAMPKAFHRSYGAKLPVIAYTGIR